MITISLTSKADSPEQIVADFKSTLELIKVYDYEKSHAWLGDLQKIMVRVHTNPGIYGEIESLFLETLSGETSFASKQVMCSYLGQVASIKAVPVLKSMLLDKDLSTMALSVLLQIPDPLVNQILREGLSEVSGLTKVGIINAIGLRRDPAAIKVLSELIFDKDSLISRSAISSLGKIETEEAARILEKAFDNTDLTLKWDILDAMLLCADKISDTNAEYALSIYYKAYDSRPPPSILFAALKGALHNKEDRGATLTYAVITTFGDPYMQTLSIPIVRDVSDDYGIQPFFKLLPGLDEYQYMQLFTAIAERNDIIVKDVVKEAVKHSNPDIVLAALMAMRHVGEAKDIEFLATIASRSRGREQDMARECLYILKGEEVNNVIIQGLQNPDPKIRVEFVRSIGERNLISAVDQVIVTLRDPDRKVRLESYKVLGKLAEPDKLNEILDISLKANTPAERKEAERTLTMIALKIANENKRANEFLKILPDVKDEASLVMLIQTLGNIGSKPALPVIQEYLTSETINIQIAAIKALSVWPDSAPIHDLKTIVESSNDIKAHNLAMRGYVRMIQIDENMTEEKRGGECIHAFEQANNLDEQKIVVSGMAEVATKETFQMAIDLLSDPELKAEAEAAISKIAGPLGGIYPEFTKAELNKLIESTNNPKFKSRLQEILKWMD